MLLKGTIASQLSGSLAGLTASHNRGGQYLRARVIPTDPLSSLQAQMRAAMSEANNAWAGLTQTQRDDWDNYALNTPLLNSLGDPVNVGGKGMFIRGNVPRLYATIVTGTDLPLVTAAPTTMGLPAAAGLVIGDVDASADTVSIEFDNTAAWAADAAAALLVFTGAPISPARTFFKGPYRLAGMIIGAMTPPTSPAAVALATGVSTGQKIGVRVVLSTSDGRLSEALRELRVAVP